MAQNVSNIARGAQYTAEDARTAAQAIRSGLDPMLRDIEVQSGMTQGANVLQNRLFADAGLGSMGTYYSALASKLPAYVNQRRAFEAEEEKKRKASAGSGNITISMPSGYGMPLGNLPPVTSLLPQTSYGVRGKTGPEYVTSPYGAIPQSVVTPKAPVPASRVLAQRKYSMNRAAAM